METHLLVSECGFMTLAAPFSVLPYQASDLHQGPLQTAGLIRYKFPPSTKENRWGFRL